MTQVIMKNGRLYRQASSFIDHLLCFRLYARQRDTGANETDTVPGHQMGKIITKNTLLLSRGLRMNTGISFLLLYARIHVYNNEIIASTSKDYVEKMYVHLFMSLSTVDP